MTLQKPNTKLHWTALALTQYYNQHETSARARDLFPLLNDIYETGDGLVASLAKLDTNDIIDHHVVMSENPETGQTAKTWSYYPTNITIDRLRDVGEPTQLPDGSPVPDDWDTSIPRHRVAQKDDIDPPTEIRPPAKYSPNLKEGAGGTHSSYDTSRVSEPAEGYVGSDEPDDDAASDDAYECDTCGDTFDTQAGLAGHSRTHSDDEEDDATDEPADEHKCPHCGRIFDSGKALGGHKRWCDGGDDGKVDLVADDLPVDSTEFDPPSKSDDDLWEEPGSLASNVNWTSMARDLEVLAQEARSNGMTEVATAYSQFAALASEANLDRRTALMLTGTPLLDIEGDGDLDTTEYDLTATHEH